MLCMRKAACLAELKTKFIELILNATDYFNNF